MKDLIRLEEDLTKEVNEQLNNHLEYLIEIGLYRKGFNFNNKESLYDFVKENCDLKSYGMKDIYSVMGDEFLLIDRNIDFSLENATLICSYAKCKYL